MKFSQLKMFSRSGCKLKTILWSEAAHGDFSLAGKLNMLLAVSLWTEMIICFRLFNDYSVIIASEVCVKCFSNCLSSFKRQFKGTRTMQGKVCGDAFEVVQLSGDSSLICGSTSAVKVPGC